MHSLRKQLVFSTTAVTTVVLAAAGVLLHMLIRDALVRELDQTLVDRARLVAAAVEWERGRPHLELEGLEHGGRIPFDSESLVQIWVGGRLVLSLPRRARLWKPTDLWGTPAVRRSPSAGEASSGGGESPAGGEPFVPSTQAAAFGPTVQWVRLSDGRPARAATLVLRRGGERRRSSEREEWEERRRADERREAERHESEGRAESDEPHRPERSGDAAVRARPSVSDARVSSARTADDRADRFAAVVVARDASFLLTFLRQLRWLLFGVGVLAVGASAASLWLAIRRSLRPVERLATEIAGIDEQALGKKIDVPGVPVELRPVLERLNQLLKRLDEAFQRERTFSADVAHEFRTPLAGLRSLMDVTLTRPRSADQYRQTLQQCRQVTQELERVVQHLLTLTRLDAGQLELHRERVPLRPLLDELWQAFEPTARQRRLEVRWNVEADVQLDTDRALTVLVFRNLLENAVTYCNEGGRVEVEAGRSEGHVVVCVANTGSQIPPEQADQVFARFWRGDVSRSGTGLHSGLGLSLVREAVRALGGQVQVQTELGGVFRVTVTLPLHPASPGGSEQPAGPVPDGRRP